MIESTALHTIQDAASALWQKNHRTLPRFTFLAHTDPCFLVLISLSSEQTTQASTASELLTIAMAENACISAQGLMNVSLWDMAAQASCQSSCHVYLNLDLLTVDAHVQDWGDFKIKPEQVEVQRHELTHAALFHPRLGFVVQVLKSALPTFTDMLRTAHLSAFSTTIGKTWGEAPAGQGVLDIYRDAKKQASFSAQELLALKTKVEIKNNSQGLTK